MIVSVLFDMDPNSDSPSWWGWSYYLFLDRCVNNDWELIVDEKYIDWAKTEADNQYLDAAGACWKFKRYNNADAGKKIHVIPNKLIKSFMKENGVMSPDKILKARNPITDIIISYLEDIKKKNVVDGLIIYPKLPNEIRNYALDNHIKTLVLEAGPNRLPVYWGGAYISENNQFFWDYGELKNRYEEYKKEQDIPLLNRLTLQLLLIEDEYLKYISCEKIKSDIEALVVGGMSMCYAIAPESWGDCRKMLKTVKKIFGDDAISFRPDLRDEYGAKYNVKPECLSEENPGIVSILKAKRVFSNGSNMMFEAMLWGKPVYCDSKNSFLYFICNHSNDLADRLVPVDFLNFIYLIYIAPMELATTGDYINWRISEPSFVDIYIKHLTYYLNKRGISKFDLNRLKEDDYILNLLKSARYSCINTYEIRDWNDVKVSFGYTDGPDVDKNNYYRNIELELEEYKKSTENLSKEKEKLQNNFSQVVAERNMLQDSLSDMTIEKNNLQQDNNHLEEELANKESAILETLNEKKELEIELNRIYNSKSWNYITTIRNIAYKLKLK